MDHSRRRFLKGAALGAAAALAPIRIGRAFASEPTIRVFVGGRVRRFKLENYLVGVVAKEVYPDWPLESLKAQAVASRTYAIRKIAEARTRGLDYDVTATVEHQAWEEVKLPADAPVRRAVAQTRSEVLCYEGEPIEAAFHSTCGGHTVDAEAVWSQPVPYLRGVPCEWCTGSPNYFWTFTLEDQQFIEALGRAGVRGSSVEAVELLKRDGLYTIDAIRVVTNAGHYTIDAEQFRNIMGANWIRSLKLDFRVSDHEVKILGSGAGHGVGMCQWGTRGQAVAGRDYGEILHYYYSGTSGCSRY